MKPIYRFIAVCLVVGVAAPVQAAKPVRVDPIEQASATLSENLAQHQAEQAQMMQMQAQQFAMFREAAYLDPAAPAVVSQTGPVVEPGVTPQPVTSSTQSVEPLVAEALVLESLSPSLVWLNGQNDPAVTGFTPVAGREGLLVGFNIPADDPLSFLRGRSWTYDNAVGAIALLLQGQAESAREVLVSLQGLMAPDGSLKASYQVDSSGAYGPVRTGHMAWVGYAMALYQTQTGDKSFQASAEKIGAYLKTLQLSSGSLKGGSDVNWVSTEHNIDAYFFYRELYRATRKSAYKSTASQIERSLLRNHWTGSSSSGHFLQGINDPTPALDANSWGAIFLAAIGKKSQANTALTYVENTFKNTQTVNGTPVTGYSPDAAKRTVWVEGTAGVSAAYVRVGKAAQGQSILDAVASLEFLSGAFPYASPRYVNSDGDTFSDLESVASTGWREISLHLLAGSSAFWDAD